MENKKITKEKLKELIIDLQNCQREHDEELNFFYRVNKGKALFYNDFRISKEGEILIKKLEEKRERLNEIIQTDCLEDGGAYCLNEIGILKVLEVLE